MFGESMVRVFDRSMFIMLLAIMIGAILITYFVADIINRSRIETITTEHVVEIEDINSRNENFTDRFLQGSIKMDSARESREVANLYFDFAFFWYTNAVVDADVWFKNKWVNTTEELLVHCINNCTQAMDKYLLSYKEFGESKPYFEEAKAYTERARYIEVLGYYIGFAKCGQNITLLRYNATKYLKEAAENLSMGNEKNATLLFNLFNDAEQEYTNEVKDYEDRRDQIDEYTFFEEERTKPGV
jgi:hypothetical protein